MRKLPNIIIVLLMALSVNVVSFSATPTERVGIWVESASETYFPDDCKTAIRAGNLVLLSVPTDSLQSYCSKSEFNYLGRPKKAYVTLNTSRPYIGVDKILPGENHVPDIIPYTGKGVVIGIIDSGIDPRHITFNDSEGNSRVKAYVFTESSEERKDGMLHADWYRTPEEIAASPVDPSEGGHGTHTASTAAGSWKGNPYMGIAPDAELVLVGTGAVIYDDEIIYGMKAVSEYGLNVGKPTVMSLSLGSDNGPRDGTSPVGLLSRTIAEAGQTIFFSAGNDGQRTSSIQRNFSVDTTTVRSMFQKYHTGKNHIIGLEAWSRDTLGAEIQIMVTHRDKVKYVGPWFSPAQVAAEGGKITLVSTNATCKEAMPQLHDWLAGNLTLEMGVYGPDKRFYIDLEGSVDEYMPGDIPMLAFAIRSPQGADMRIYANASRNTLVSWEAPGFMYGTAAENISDFAASPHVIGVGMINGRESVRTMGGELVTLASMKFGGINEPNRFSSYGTTLDGKTLPQILAPGSLVVAALYPEAPGMERNYVCDTVIDGKRYVWGHDSGTSMSSPTAAGVAALWLEAVPSLTRNDIEEILEKTSNRNVSERFPQNSAYGCIDAYAGLKYAIERFSVKGVQTDSSPRLSIRFLDNSYSAGSRIECVVPGCLQQGRVEFYNADGRLIQAQQASGTSFETTLPQWPGIYILRVTGTGFSASQKLVVK